MYGPQALPRAILQAIAEKGVIIPVISVMRRRGGNFPTGFPDRFSATAACCNPSTKQPVASIECFDLAHAFHGNLRHFCSLTYREEKSNCFFLSSGNFLLGILQLPGFRIFTRNGWLFGARYAIIEEVKIG